MKEYVTLFGCSYFLYVEMESIFFFFCIVGKPDTDVFVNIDYHLYDHLYEFSSVGWW